MTEQPTLITFTLSLVLPLEVADTGRTVRDPAAMLMLAHSPLVKENLKRLIDVGDYYVEEEVRLDGSELDGS